MIYDLFSLHFHAYTFVSTVYDIFFAYRSYFWTVGKNKDFHFQTSSMMSKKVSK